MYVRSSHLNVACVVISKYLKFCVKETTTVTPMERLGMKRFDTSLSTTGNPLSLIP